MMMLKKMYPGQQQSMGQTPIPPRPQMTPMGTNAERLNVPGMQPGPGQMDAGGTSMLQQLLSDPQKLKQIFAALRLGQGGGGLGGY